MLTNSGCLLVKLFQSSANDFARFSLSRICNLLLFFKHNNNNNNKNDKDKDKDKDKYENDNDNDNDNDDDDNNNSLYYMARSANWQDEPNRAL